MHGGKPWNQPSPSPETIEGLRKRAYRHGLNTKEAMAEFKEANQLVKEAKQTLKKVKEKFASEAARQ